MHIRSALRLLLFFFFLSFTVRGSNPGLVPFVFLSFFFSLVVFSFFFFTLFAVFPLLSSYYVSYRFSHHSTVSKSRRCSLNSSLLPSPCHRVLTPDASLSLFAYLTSLIFYCQSAFPPLITFNEFPSASLFVLINRLKVSLFLRLSLSIVHYRISFFLLII